MNEKEKQQTMKMRKFPVCSGNNDNMKNIETKQKTHISKITQEIFP